MALDKVRQCRKKRHKTVQMTVTLKVKHYNLKKALCFFVQTSNCVAFTPQNSNSGLKFIYTSCSTKRLKSQARQKQLKLKF